MFNMKTMIQEERETNISARRSRASGKSVMALTYVQVNGMLVVTKLILWAISLKLTNIQKILTQNSAYNSYVIINFNQNE